MMRRLYAALFCLFSWASPCLALEGRVVDANTGIGIAGATVTLGPRVITTDKNGYFHSDGSEALLQARAAGYLATAIPVSQLAGRALELRPFRPRALYLSLYGIGSKSLRNAALNLIHEEGLNALVIDVKGDRGNVAYHSAVPLTRAIGAQGITTIPDLHGLVETLHRQGIYLIARIVTFKDNFLASARPDLAIKLANGALFRDREGLGWTNPSLKEARDYNIAVAVEAARAGFDEIQFDYLRFPDVPRGQKFAVSTTEASRLQAIGEFLTEARLELAPYNVYLAADVFGYVCWNLNDTGIGQGLSKIMPMVDYASPMLYPSGFQFGIPGYPNPVQHPYDIVRLSLDRAQARTGFSPIHFRPWLQVFKDYAFDRRQFGASEVAAQIRAATDFGSDGWMLWNPRNVYSKAGLPQPEPPALALARCF